MSQSCIFCVWSGQPGHVWENSAFFARFDAFPVSPGHILIIPKQHTVDLLAVSESDWGLLREGLQAVVQLIPRTDLVAVYRSMIQETVSDISIRFCRKALRHPRINTTPDAYNHGVNDGRAAGRTVDHLHWHVIPRYDGDTVDPVGGVRHVITRLGNYRRPDSVEP